MELSEKTPFQIMEEQEKREFIQEFIDLCQCSSKSFKVLANTIKQEQEFCKERHITLPKIYP